ncbi:hypothetical protein RJ640_026052 [Escallonia rubra]|uniref:Uncharacterized protein n=1 Tax=Escallonia rubra TaxID=112253 RepID=A0AA88RJR5_9ASTE|nr:hypothetical protein RJ640_026052 [Escallonia rubra]
MSPQSALNTGRALEGLHGVHLVPHSPFALEEINQREDFHQSTCQSSAIGARQQLIVQKNLNCKLYANSLIGVGVASSLYHASRGKYRKYFRWADYTMIATATVCLSRALSNENPKLLMAASALCLPVQPLMVSAVHTGMMEIFLTLFEEPVPAWVLSLALPFRLILHVVGFSFMVVEIKVAFAKRALQDPDLKMAHNVHKMSSLLGGAFFIADDAFPETPFLHAAWHLAAAIGVSTCNKLLE